MIHGAREYNTLRMSSHLTILEGLSESWKFTLDLIQDPACVGLQWLSKEQNPICRSDAWFDRLVGLRNIKIHSLPRVTEKFE